MKISEPKASDVIFAVTPFASLSFPVIGVSLLKAELAECGIPSTIRYFNLEFGKSLGHAVYGRIADSFGSAALLGDWVFSTSLHDDDEEDEDWYELQFLSDFPDHRALLLQARKARHIAEAHLDCWADEIAALRPRIVGFPTSFQQNAATLALAKRLKQKPDPPLVIFGGANCLGEMGVGLLRAFPWIDYVCNGEGDEVFPLFVRRVLASEEVGEIPGILKQSPNVVQTLAPLVGKLDDTPVPDYSDFFREFRQIDMKPLKPNLPIETSRGCWWGQKHHCTFCSIWDSQMAFRSKSPERAYAEFMDLAKRYRVTRFLCVDNILDMRYIPTLFPKLAKSKPKLQIFYEVKANLRYDQLRTLRDGGVKWIQPGIESFSDEILRIMKKGCTGLQNLQLLRWSREMGLHVAWNMLFGFPGEPPAEYAKVARLIPKLHHLQPPVATVQIRMDRYSPNFMEPKTSGFREVQASKYYSHLFDASADDLHLMAHFFDYEYADGRRPYEYTRQFRRACEEWQIAYKSRPVLDAWDDGEAIRIKDTRACAVRLRTQLTGLRAGILRALDMGMDRDALRRRVITGDGDGFKKALAYLVKENFVAPWQGKYIALAVFRKRPEKATETGMSQLVVTDEARSSLVS